MKILYVLLPIIIALWLRIWRWYFASNVPKPKTTIIKQISDNIQIRETKAQVYASITVTSSESEAPNKAFNILAWYIFGNNTSKSKLAMTAPVISQKETKEQDEVSEKIAMTAPVITQKSSESEYTVSFVMPQWYTLQTLPTPNDSRINIYEVLPKKIIVIQFNGYTTQDRINKYNQELTNTIKTENITTTWEYIIAQYNDPRTPRFMRTNEIWIEISK